MRLKWFREELELKHRWTIARGSSTRDCVLIIQLNDGDTFGWGEAAPSQHYGENIQTVEQFLSQVDASRLDFDDIPGSMAYLESVSTGNAAAKGAIDIALWDGAGRRAGKPVYDLLGLGFREGVHQTSFSIGIDAPEVVRIKTQEAEKYPILKIKVGVPGDRESMAAVRAVAPNKRIRVDANEGWRSREQALEMLEWLARDKQIEFCEQPMPANTPDADLAWLKERSPLPLMADESCIHAQDIPRCRQFFHAVNVKLVKTGGISRAFETLRAARDAGLSTMLGCMIETSVLISAAAHLAELTNYLDLDGNLLIANDPFAGVDADRGVISFRTAPEAVGLRVARRV